MGAGSCIHHSMRPCALGARPRCPAYSPTRVMTPCLERLLYSASDPTCRASPEWVCGNQCTTLAYCTLFLLQPFSFFSAQTLRTCSILTFKFDGPAVINLLPPVAVLGFMWKLSSYLGEVSERLARIEGRFTTEQAAAQPQGTVAYMAITN